MGFTEVSEVLLAHGADLSLLEKVIQSMGLKLHAHVIAVLKELFLLSVSLEELLYT